MAQKWCSRDIVLFASHNVACYLCVCFVSVVRRQALGADSIVVVYLGISRHTRTQAAYTISMPNET